jgi:hypothetical protein
MLYVGSHSFTISLFYNKIIYGRWWLSSNSGDTILIYFFVINF